MPPNVIAVVQGTEPLQLPRGTIKEDLLWNLAIPLQDEATHPGGISSKPVPLGVCWLNRRIGNGPHKDRHTERTCGSGFEGGKIPGGRVILMRVANDG